MYMYLEMSLLTCFLCNIFYAVEMKFGRAPHGLEILRQAVGFENRTGPSEFVKAPLGRPYTGENWHVGHLAQQIVLRKRVIMSNLSAFKRAICSLSRVAKYSPKICPHTRANCWAIWNACYFTQKIALVCGRPWATFWLGGCVKPLTSLEKTSTHFTLSVYSLYTK